MRLIKIGGKTYDVTDNVQKITKEFSCIPVEGQLSCNVSFTLLRLPLASASE
jgi:hypothetical protein